MFNSLKVEASRHLLPLGYRWPGTRAWASAGIWQYSGRFPSPSPGLGTVGLKFWLGVVGTEDGCVL